MSAGSRLTHIGLCVSDIDQSVQFFCSALGFEEIRRLRVDGAETAQLLDVPGVLLDLVYLQRDGMCIELLGYQSPATIGDRSMRAMNKLGFTHLSFLVDDVEAMVERVVACGGRLLPECTVTFGGGNRGLMAADPDGNRLELIERTAARPRPK